MPPINNPQVFIIEDDEHIATIFKLACEKAGYEPLVIADGHNAMECLREMTPYLIILDLHLPLVSGCEILAYIQATERLSASTTVIVSADYLKVEQLKQEGHRGLLKPVGFRQMHNYCLAVTSHRKGQLPKIGNWR